MTTVYKIRDRAKKLFSSGGYRPRWCKKGKTWPKASMVINYLRDLVGSRKYAQHYANAEIVEIEITEKEIKTEDVLSKMHDLMAEDFEKLQKYGGHEMKRQPFGGVNEDY